MSLVNALKACARWACFLALMFPIVMPLLWLVGSWHSVDGQIWDHLIQTQLKDLVVNTVTLLLGVGAFSLLLGVGSAWVIVRFDFPGRAWLEWLLVLPLAVPAYVLAFVIEGWLGVGGPWYQHCVSVLGRVWVCQPPAGAKAVMSLTLVLYPYVYLLARIAFMRQSPQLLAVSRSLGLTSMQGFLRVVLPLARPALVAGMSLVLMETAADFGAVSVFNFDTFTTAIYKTWYGLFDLLAATQLASVLMGGMFLLVLVERLSRRSMRYEGPAVSRMTLRPLS